MAIDNSLYDSLELTYAKIKNYLDNTQLGREHSAMIMKHEELSSILETFDIEALEEQSKDIYALHKQLDTIKELSNIIIEDLDDVSDSVATSDSVTNRLDEIFFKITNISV